MKRHAVLRVLGLFSLLVPLTILLLSCGGGGGGGSSDGGSGTVSMSITDAKPKLPANAEHVYITFDEVQVHKAGGGWITLPVVAPAPHTIDLLLFSDGSKTQLVPPVRLESGKYTQVRIIVSDAWLVIGGVNYPLIVPSGKLRTDKNFDFEVHGGGAVDLIVDFDLSQSIVDQGNGGYSLKPVLHLAETLEAATIRGTIPTAAFGSATQATVTVWWDKDGDCTFDDPSLVPPDQADEVYTEVVVPKADPSFEIFWLVPNEAYIVQIEIGGNKFFFTVPGTPGACQTLLRSAVFDLDLATIQGSIDPNNTFDSANEADVIVTWDRDASGTVTAGDVTYSFKVSQANPVFSILVLANEAYVVQVEVNGTLKYQEPIPASALPAGGPPFPLNGGAAIKW